MRDNARTLLTREGIDPTEFFNAAISLACFNEECADSYPG
jgi:hypothetical protein